jgi:hypothetical protein
MMQDHFANLIELDSYINANERGGLMIEYRNVEGYAGMVLGISMYFNQPKKKYELDLQWISFGLDLYGENLLENYTYAFPNIEALLNYLSETYSIDVTDIPITFKGNYSQFPNPIQNSDQKTLFEADWERFQADFKTGQFLDVTLKLVYSSQE